MVSNELFQTKHEKAEKEPVILLIGQARREEFTDAVRFLNRLGEVHLTLKLQDAIDEVRQKKILPKLVVLLASRPGEFREGDVHHLRTLVPLARLVNLLGSWCEGEMRTGTPLPGMIRLYWHEWEPVCHRELLRLGDPTNSPWDGTSTWSMPVTATEEEHLLTNRPLTLPAGSGLVAIDSPSPAMAGWVAEACEKQGYATVLCEKFSQGTQVQDVGAIRGVRIVIVDATECNRVEQARIRTLQARWPSARMIVLLDFPRIHQRRRLQDQGIDTVVSKPITLEGLLWHVQQLAGNVA